MLWLEDKLNESSADWQIIVTHFPPEHWTHFPQNTVDLKRLGDKYGIDLIVAGHRHDQELHPSGDWAVDIMDGFGVGVPFVVTGGGGGVTSENDPWIGSDEPGADQYGFMDMTISKTEIKIEAINFDGKKRADMLVNPRPRQAPPLCSVISCGAEWDPKLPCQCNAECTGYGSCCEDFNDECAGTCKLYGCNHQYDQRFECQCTADCKEKDTCCADFDELCLETPDALKVVRPTARTPAPAMDMSPTDEHESKQSTLREKIEKVIKHMDAVPPYWHEPHGDEQGDAMPANLVEV